MRIKKNQKSVENELKLEMRCEEHYRSAMAMINTGASMMMMHETLTCEEQMMLRTVAAWSKKWVVSERFTPEFKRLIDGLEDW